MVKTTKRIAAAILAATMTFSLAACGEKETSSTSAPADSGAGSEASKTEASSGAGSSEAASGDNSEAATSGDTSTPETYDGPKEAEDLADIIPKETVTLDVFSETANYQGEQEGWFAKVMLDKFNVKLNIISGTAEAFNTRMEAGNLGDIIVFGGTGDYGKAAKANLLWDWEDEDIGKDYAPYVWNNFQTALETAKNITESDGKIHGFGHDIAYTYDDKEEFKYWPGIRWDLYKAQGSPEIKTLDDYIPVLKQMQKDCPTSDSGKKTYGVSLFPDWDGDMVMMVKAISGLYGYDEFGVGLYNCNDDTWESALDSDGQYIKALKWYNKLNQEGLLDPDSATQTYPDLTAKSLDGAIFFNQFGWMTPKMYNTTEHLEAGKAMYPVAANDMSNIVYMLAPYGRERLWSIGSKTQHPELCMAIINWLSTPEGVLTMNYGPKGDGESKDAGWYYKDGKPTLTEVGQTAQSNKKDTKFDGIDKSFEDGECKINNTTLAKDAKDPDNGETFNWERWDTLNVNLNYDVFKDWASWAKATDKFDEYFDQRTYTRCWATDFSWTELSTELEGIKTNVCNYLKTASYKSIFAKDDAEFDSIIKDMQDKCKEYGSDQLEEFYKSEAARRAEATKRAKEKAGI